ncbi:MAG: hypothetical protein WCO31_07000, partial [Actinomycetes bacterium]
MPAGDLSPTVIYATSGWGVHDDRWVGGLAAAGFTVVRANEPKQVAELVEASGAIAVLAGPLFSVAGLIGPLNVPLVGLSWGFDLNEEISIDGESGGLEWLIGIAGLI